MIIPAQLELKTDDKNGMSYCATCTRCGQVTSVPLGNKKSEAKAAALVKLEEACPRRPAEMNQYRDRVIPAGVTLWFHHLERLYPLQVTGRTVCAVAGPVISRVPIYVIPDTPADAPTAEDFAVQLTKWGYTAVKAKPAGFKLPTPQAAVSQQGE